MLVAINVIKRVRLAAITPGGTVMANAASYADAAALACVAVCSACAAAVVIHSTYGAAAAAIEAEDGPSHGPPLSSEITVPYEAAVDWSSAASPSQAVAADSIGPEPGPAYILPELTSGGNIAKFIAVSRLNRPLWH